MISVSSFQGFTKFYEFSSADLRAAADIINRLFMKSGKKKESNFHFVGIRVI